MPHRLQRDAAQVMAETVTKVGFTITGEGQGCFWLSQVECFRVSMEVCWH